MLLISLEDTGRIPLSMINNQHKYIGWQRNNSSKKCLLIQTEPGKYKLIDLEEMNRYSDWGGSKERAIRIHSDEGAFYLFESLEELLEWVT